jgi:peptidoglycan/LPS O-acetylase OafA/YrhL
VTPVSSAVARIRPRIEKVGGTARGWAGIGPVQTTGFYRPEVDGLRAVAVGLVILFHAQFRIGGVDPFPGGFIGVDIFLVISGYLIGLILLREMDAGSFSLIRFYERRARRILPALYVVLALTLPLAWWLMLPTELKTYGASLTSAVGSVANIFFWQSGSYDAGDNLTTPLIHTWSLGVEEQFYLLFPALLLVVGRYARRWMMQILAGLTVVSLTVAEMMTVYAPNASFYLLPSRIWELAIGAMLALHELNGGRERVSFRLRWAPLVGLVAILACVPFMSTHHHHPGLLTLIPVAGTALIIRYAGHGDIAGRWLASMPMVSIGLISYSLYLWHQPILAFGRLLRVDDAPASVKLGWILLAIVAAVVTFHLVERPTRNRRRVGSRSIWIIAAVGGIALAGAGTMLVMTKGAPGRFAPPLDAIARAEIVDEATIMQRGLGCMNYVPARGPCVFRGADPSGYNLLLIGDSHARLLSGALIHRLGTSTSFASVTLLNRGGCLFLPRLVRVDDDVPSCPDSYNRARLDYALGQPRAIAVIMMRLPIVVERSRFDNGTGGIEPGNAPHLSVTDGPYNRAVDDERIRAGIIGTVERLIQQGVKVVLVYPVPEMGWNIPRKLLQLARTEPEGAWLSPQQASVSRRQYLVRSRRSYALLDAAGVHPDITRVYPERLFCAGTRCFSHDGTAIFYRDDNHLSRTGADRLAEVITTTIDDRWGPTEP